VPSPATVLDELHPGLGAATTRPPRPRRIRPSTPSAAGPVPRDSRGCSRNYNIMVRRGHRRGRKSGCAASCIRRRTGFHSGLFSRAASRSTPAPTSTFRRADPNHGDLFLTAVTSHADPERQGERGSAHRPQYLDSGILATCIGAARSAWRERITFGRLGRGIRGSVITEGLRRSRPRPSGSACSHPSCLNFHV